MFNHSIYKNSKNITDANTKLQNKYISFSSATKYVAKIMGFQGQTLRKCGGSCGGIQNVESLGKDFYKYECHLKCSGRLQTENSTILFGESNMDSENQNILKTCHFSP